MWREAVPAYLDALRDAGIYFIGGIPVPEWSPGLALEFMDAHGIAVQMLSVSDPGVEFAAEAAPGLARTCSDYIAGVVREHPERFGAFALLSLKSVEATRSEAARALDELKLDGVGLLSSYTGHYLGDPLLEPLMAELDERRAWVMVHPTALAAEQKPALGIPDFIAEYPFDTARTIISLLFNGTFQRYPNIRWQFAHGGGTVAMLRLRLTGLAGAAKEFGPALGLPSGASVLATDTPTQALRSSFFDTALVADVPCTPCRREHGWGEPTRFRQRLAIRCAALRRDRRPTAGAERRLLRR